MGRDGGKGRQVRGRHGREEDEKGGGEADGGAGAGFREPGPQPSGQKRNNSGGKQKQASGGKAGSQAEGGPSIKTTRDAKLAVATKLRALLQRSFSDVPRFTLNILEAVGKKALQKEIQRFIRERTDRFSFVQATECQKVPVTPPHHSEGDDESDDANIRANEVTYHILVFVTVTGVLEVLVREYDGYVVAIRPQPTDLNQNHGWFVFSVVNLPEHLFGDRNWKMKYNTGYMGQHKVEMGKKCFDKLVEVLVMFNENNYKKRTTKRREMLETLKVFAGEAQRLSVVLRFFPVNVEADPWVPVGTKLSFWTNHWANLGDAIMHIVLALLAKLLLGKEAAESEAERQMAAARGFLKAFKSKDSEIDIPLTQDDFVGSIEAGYIKPVFLMGSEMVGPVFGADEARDKLSLPLLMSYIMLFKFEKNLVPQLILSEDAYRKALKLKGKSNEARQMLSADGSEHDVVEGG